MKKFFVIALALLCSISLSPAQSKPEQEQAEGKALAAEINSMGPVKDSNMTGTLHIQQRKKKEIVVPIEMKLIKTEDTWKSIYQTRDTNYGGFVALTILQGPTQKNAYELLTSTNRTSASRLSDGNANIAFAESDFWLSDLGLEFFRWPEQRVTKKEMCRNQFCFVLESKNSQTGSSGYSRVVSWIDKDTLGIVLAEAYDQNGKHLKTFKPKSVQKVNGRYQIKEVEMRNVQTGSETLLEFDAHTE